MQQSLELWDLLPAVLSCSTEGEENVVLCCSLFGTWLGGYGRGWECLQREGDAQP